MARIRTIKPEFWTDSLIVQLDTFTRLLFIGLWTAADDHGAIRDELDRIAMEIMPREDPDNVKHSIDLLIACGRITRMLNDDGSSYLIIDKWAEHQRVDKPAKSKIIREGSRKLAISPETRRAVAAKYGCAPGERKEATCYFCGCSGGISWPLLYSGKPSGWVSFCDLELDHFQPESKGGDNSSSNLVLSCRHCNRARNNKSAFDFVTKGLGSIISPNAREGSRELMVGRDQGKEQGKEIDHGASAGADDLPQQAQISESESGLNPEQLAVPESGLNPDGPTEPVSGLTPEQVSEPAAGLNPERASGPVPPAEKINYQTILDVYHEVLPEMPRVKILTDDRKKHLRTFWKKYQFDDRKWRSYLGYIATRCRWMLTDRPNGRGGFWKCKNLDYLITERCYVAVKEERANDK